MKQTALVMLVASIVLLSGAAAQADWIAGADLYANEKPDGNHTNPNGPWSYGYRDTAASATMTLLTTHTDNYDSAGWLEGWTGPASFSTPNVVVSTNTVAYVPFPNLLAINPQEIFTHPGHTTSTAYAVVRWTAPAAGLYQVTATWRDIDQNGGGGIQALLFQNLTQKFSQDVLNNTASTSQQLSVAAGDTLDFVVGNNGTFFNDATGFDATIAVVPEPGTLLLLAAAAITLLAGRRRQ